MANIKEIAKAAGVSTSTVSRVLNNNSLISPKMRNHVLEVMRKYNYVPNAMARGLSNKKANAITLLVNHENAESFDNFFFHKIMYGIENLLYRSDLFLLVSNFEDSRIARDRLTRMVQSKLTQGIIVPSFILTTDLLKTLENLNIPFVVLGEPEHATTSFDWVDINNFQGGQLATQHLITAGYHRVAFLSDGQQTVFNKNRLSGYQSALTQQCIAINNDFIEECDGSKDSAFMAMSKLLALPTPPDAVVCTGNVIGVGAMAAIQQKGYEIPRDFGLVCFDNSPIADLMNPSMTTVAVDVFGMGAEAARLLLQLITNETVTRQTSLIATSIEIRKSSKKLKEQ